MKASGIIIDESLQQNTKINGRKPQEREVEQFPTQIVTGNSSESYSTVV